MHSEQSIDTFEISSNLIHRFGYERQNYALYPTTDRFIEAFDVHAYIDWVSNRKIGGLRRPLSLYVHIPFCSSLCFYCNYNQIVTNNNQDIKKYLGYLLREIQLQGKLFHDAASVDQLHFGGGTPIFMSIKQLRSIMDEIQKSFHLIENGEFSIKIDPRQNINTSMAALREMGFNHIIVGVQDFNQAVQQAIQRVQTEDETLRTIHAAQYEGFKSIRIELLYGLPKQSVKNFNETLEKIIATCPNQIILKNYLHLPEKFKPQRHIKAEDLPLAEARFEIKLNALRRLNEAGYIHIGMNHFARNDDKLVIAQQQGRLHYNMHGYSAHADSDHIGLGLSAIGSIGPTHSQNHLDVELYYDRLEQNILPIMRGLELTADDLLRRSVMHALICHSVLCFESVETFFPVNFKQYFATELTEFLEYEKFGLLTLGDEEITITPKGRLLIFSICMVFDKYLRLSNERRHYSKII